MSSTDTLGRLCRVYTSQFPSVEGWQAKPDGVVVSCLHQSIPLLWRGVKLCLTGWWPRICISIVLVNSPPAEGCQAPLDGVVAPYLYKYSASQFPSCGGVSSSA